MEQAMFVSNTAVSEASKTMASRQAYALLEFDKNQPVVIEEIIQNPRFGDIDKVVEQRLKDLGFLPNTALRIVAKGLFGKPPYAVQLASGVQFSLRMDELKKIRCRVL